MKLFKFFAVSIALQMLTLSGCVTTGEQVKRTEIFGFENEDLSARLEITSGKWVELKLTNKKDDALILQTDLASFSHDGDTEKLIPSGTKYVDSARSQPPIPIPPNSFFSKGFSSASASRYDSSFGWITDSWIPPVLTTTTFIFGYIAQGKEKFILFKGSELSKYSPTQKPTLGKVNVEDRFWNFLFLKSVSERRETLKNMAIKKTKDAYGPDAELRNLQYEGQWSPLSLLLYFRMVGFVEEASLEAEVFKPN